MSNMTAAGWPRPIVDGWPIPWVSPSDDLSYVCGDRTEVILRDKVCQVCGEGHAPGSLVFLCVSCPEPAEPGDFTRRALEYDEEGLRALAMDHAVMHERCLRLAVARCPELRRMRELGRLQVLRAPIESVCVVKPPDNRIDQIGVPVGAAHPETEAFDL